MSENPYRLARDFKGIGFRTADVIADAIAEKLGIEKTAMVRVCAGISYALTEAMGQGHCGLPVAELKGLEEKLLGVDRTLITTALDLELADGSVIGRLACNHCCADAADPATRRKAPGAGEGNTA